MECRSSAGGRNRDLQQRREPSTPVRLDAGGDECLAAIVEDDDIAWLDVRRGWSITPRSSPVVLWRR